MISALSILPVISSRAEYARLYEDAGRWRPAAQTIAQAHGIATHNLTRMSEGSNVVFAAGPYVIKIFPPYYRPLFEAEQAVTTHVYGKLPSATPLVWAAGHLDGWPYLITTRLTGVALSQVWPTMDAANQLAIVRALGELLACLHNLPTRPLQWLAPNWRAFVGERWRNAVVHHRDKGVPAHWLQQIPGFLAGAAPLSAPTVKPVLLNNDLHQYHLLVTWNRDAWQLCGLFDFDDAFLGFREYDFATTGLFLMAGRSDLLRAFLSAYGYAEADMDAALSARLLAYTLLHRYRDFNWILGTILKGRHPATLRELAGAIYPFA